MTFLMRSITIYEFKFEIDQDTSKPGGTLHSMSPEMGRLYLKRAQDIEIDYKTDLVSFASDYYSLGILAYELLVGSPPYGYCKNGSTLEEKIQYLDPIIKSGTTEEQYEKIEASEATVDLVKKLTALDSQKRINTFQELQSHPCFNQDMKGLIQELVKSKLFKLPEEWAKRHDDVIDFIQMTGRFTTQMESEPIDERAQQLFDMFG